MLKKLSLTPSGESDARNIYYNRTNVVSFSKRKEWKTIREDRKSYGPEKNPRLFDQYLNSFNKKRLLRIWEKNRKQVQIAPHLPEIIERLIYENVYEELSPLLKTCYQEDFHLPYLEITLQSWLQQLKLTAIELKREWDELYWEELSQFIQKCSKKQLLSDLQPRNTFPN